MSGPDPAVAEVRRAVRELLAEPVCGPYLDSGEFCVAVSGGADSLALTEAAAHVGRRSGLRVRALTVDHGLQEGSAEIARLAADQALGLGAHDARVLEARVTGRGGPEASARAARYAALRQANAGALVLLGHTRDDQAETVLLGLGRGSGPRSIAGMRPLDLPWARPLLTVSRDTTRAACRALGLRPWQDPHNSEPRFTRVRLRTEVLPLLEDVLSGGVGAALARTAEQLREDAEVLDTLAGELFDRAAVSSDGTPDVAPGERAAAVDVAVLEAAAPALRRRALRRWLLDFGVPEVSDGHLRSVDALIGAWRGQGAVWLPGDYSVRRTRGRLWVLPSQHTE